MSADDDSVAFPLGELLAWTRVRGMRDLRELLEKELVKEQDFLIYEFTDGAHNQMMIAKEVGVNQSTVSRKWTAWRELGLVYDRPELDNPTHLLSARAVGLDIPQS